MEKFKAKYEVDDGYAGGSRLQYFTVLADELNEDLTEEELRELFQTLMQEDFEQNITPYGNADEFVAWAKEVRGVK